MADDTEDTGVINLVEQRLVPFDLAGADEVLAARAEDTTIYMPVRPLCTALGLGWSPQLRKIKADEVLGDRQHIFEMEAAMGLRDYNSAAWTREGTRCRRALV